MIYRHGEDAVAPPPLPPDVRWRRLDDGDLEFVQGERVFRVPVARDDRGAIHVFWKGRSYVFTPETPGRRAAAKKSGSLSAPMTGVVADVLVSVGDRVEAYQSVAVIEAMKVLATLEAPVAGTVTAVHFQKGERVEHGAIVVEIQ
jgi:biotin carboxyl carrier protein